MCLAIEKTATIITAAGTIMSISFAGMLILKVIVLNQYGFALFMGVVFDTFYVRIILVPAIIEVLGKSNDLSWWPTKMPAVLLSPDEEITLINKGRWYPCSNNPDSKSVIMDDCLELIKLKDNDNNQSLQDKNDYVVIVDNNTTNDAVEKDDFYIYHLKKYYFPFLLKYHSYVLITWIIILILSVIWGPLFLSNTRSSYAIPPSCPSYKANKAFKDNFPSVNADYPPAIMIAHTNNKDQNIICSYTKQLSYKLKDSFGSNSNIGSIDGYWEYKDTDYNLIASDFVSSNNRTMETIISFPKGINDESYDAIVQKLIDFASSHDSSDITVIMTGEKALGLQMTDATKNNLSLIDSTVLPIALIILGVVLKSYRHIIVALINLLCSMLFTFLIMYGISIVIPIASFAPSIMMTLGIAISFDYSLFLLTRFRGKYKYNLSMYVII